MKRAIVLLLGLLGLGLGLGGCTGSEGTTSRTRAPDRADDPFHRDDPSWVGGGSGR